MAESFTRALVAVVLVMAAGAAQAAGDFVPLEFPSQGLLRIETRGSADAVYTDGDILGIRFVSSRGSLALGLAGVVAMGSRRRPR